MYTLLGHPCRNFNILAKTVIQDPKDGREKLVLANFVAGGTGVLIFVDTEDHSYETITLPGDEGAWGLVNWFNKKLVVGTCPQHAYLHCLDLTTREWAEPLSDPGEKYFWDMTVGSDGKVYGGTWPGCSLLRYDPETHELKNMGRVSDNDKNLYSRPVYGALPGTVFVAGGYDVPFLKAFDLATETFHDLDAPGYRVKEANEDFICLEKEGELKWLDSKTRQPIADLDPSRLTKSSVQLPNGQSFGVVALANDRYAGVRGQEYFIINGLTDVPELRRIPSEPSPTRIFTLTTDPEGTVWGSCGFGQTIFSYDPVRDEHWNSATVCNAGGEVYGMLFVGGKLYMSAYVGGDHIVYDPKQPWDQLSNANPRMLKSVSPDFVRPEGRSVLGPDGGIWTGWSAKYGTYGGALSRIDVENHGVDVWTDPLHNDQQVCGLTADGQYLYFTTNGGASGLGYKQVQCGFGVWKPGEGLVHQVTFDKEEEMVGNGVLAGASSVFVRVGDSIRVFSPATLEFTASIPTDAPCGWMIRGEGETILAFCGEELLVIDEASASVRSQIALPGKVHAATRSASGDIFFAVLDGLYRLSI
ncbi:hypothetical protein [Paenibacillus koleovorans]|uniref:hypothetical protein n=1 Tax=Paenibacillus koleovorans TaxID=121608 RepID=UPI000FDC34FC|nr:hypothetical protein [Paenibacillus koleovorans]